MLSKTVFDSFFGARKCRSTSGISGMDPTCAAGEAGELCLEFWRSQRVNDVNVYCMELLNEKLPESLQTWGILIAWLMSPPSSPHGRWFGASVGGDMVWSFRPGEAPVPPRTGSWKGIILS